LGQLYIKSFDRVIKEYVRIIKIKIIILTLIKINALIFFTYKNQWIKDKSWWSEIKRMI
jgi:hypothetical protein